MLPRVSPPSLSRRRQLPALFQLTLCGLALKEAKWSIGALLLCFASIVKMLLLFVTALVSKPSESRSALFDFHATYRTLVC
jgi:hypothetical protein